MAENLFAEETPYTFFFNAPQQCWSWERFLVVRTELWNQLLYSF